MRVASSQPHLTDIEVKCILRRRKILSASLLGEWNIMKHTANRGDSRSNVEQRYETLERPWWTTLLLMYCGISIQRRVKYGLLIGLDAIYWAKLSKGPCLMTRLFSQKNNMSLLKSMSNTCEHARFVNDSLKACAISEKTSLSLNMFETCSTRAAHQLHQFDACTNLQSILGA